MKIDEKMIDPGSEVYYKKEFMDVVESYIGYLKSLSTTTRILVKVEDANVYHGDLYGYLNSISQPMYLFWTIMRLNDMFSPLEFTKDTKTLLIPSARELDRIKNIYLSKMSSVGL